MKHTLKITFVILAMFLITQAIGFYVVNGYSNQKFIDGEKINVSAPILPYGMENKSVQSESDASRLSLLVIAFVLAILLIFFLTKFNVGIIMKIWFMLVINIALGIFLNLIFFKLNIFQNELNLLFTFPISWLISFVLALPITFWKAYGKNFFVHNFTEFLIYPSIAAVFVPILTPTTLIVLLVIISVYDMWAVWHSGIMQKMAKYQIKNLNIFGGFFVPYLSKKLKDKIKNMSQKQIEKKKIKVNVAILGGGDIIFPIITSGVMLVNFGIIPAIATTIGATLGLSYLLFFAEKKKFYPAMPFISAGIFLGMGISLLI